MPFDTGFANPPRVHALTGQAGDDGRLQHLAAGPRVAAHHSNAAARITGPGQTPGSR